MIGREAERTFRLNVNGATRELDLEPDRSVLSVLRNELGLTGAKPGCGEGECGACTVMLDGEPARSCVTRVDEVGDREVTTVEGLVRDGALHPVQRAFVEVGAFQCGFCTPGMVVAAAALLGLDPDPDEARIREALDGNVCRCCTYPRIVRAVRRGAELAASDEAGWPLGPEEPDDLPSPPAGPWDLREPDERDYFDVLPDGLVVHLSSDQADRAWSTSAGAWIHVGTDGAVTAFTGKVDVGQDNRTSLSQLVAEELRVPVERVRLVMGDTDLCPYDMGTFGSRSTPDAGEDLRAVAASARDLLDTIELGEGVRRIERATPAETTPPGAWRTAGHASPRATATAKVTGAHRYPTDRGLPTMLHGAMLRPPAFGATLRSIDPSDAEAIAGATVVVEDDVAGVAAPDPSSAAAGVAALLAEWDRTPQLSEEDLVDHLRATQVQGTRAQEWGGPYHDEAGDVDAAMASADLRLERTYTTAYIAHVPLETRAALAVWAGDRLTVWTGTQRPFGVREELAEALDVPEERVRVIVPDTGAGFGGKHTGEAAIEAARLARASGKPVKVTWSRREEFTWGYVRPAAVIDVRSGATRDGTITAFAFANLNAGSAGIGCPYEIPNQRIDFRPADSPLRQGSYRALAATANHFARESHLDEMAIELGVDPLELRLRHLRDERLAAVFRAAAERAGLDGRSADERSRGIGIAGGVEKDARVATCAEVGVDADGRVTVERIVTAFECGTVVNPDGLTNQIEGATVMGLGGALFEAIRFADGEILNASLSTYRVPRFSDVPPIEVILLEADGAPPAGAGETPIVAVAPAIANAIFRASGRRLRSLPLIPDGVVGTGDD